MENFKRTIIGFSNPHNLCYLNSILQFLFTIEPLNIFILKCEDIKYYPKIGMEESLLLTYRFLLQNVYTSNEYVIDDENVFEAEKF